MPCMHKNSVNNIFITSCRAARRAFTGLSGAKQQLLALSRASHPAGDRCLHCGDTSPVVTAGQDANAQVTAASRGTNSLCCQGAGLLEPGGDVPRSGTRSPAQAAVHTDNVRLPVPE